MDIVWPRDLEGALSARAAMPEADMLAGGTDLMVEVNFGQRRPTQVIAVRRIDELRVENGRKIGAGVTWAQLERSSHTALAQAARTIGSPQIRNAGTIGGNIGTASPAGDGLPWIAALDADIEVASQSRGARLVPWDEFFVGVKRTSLEADEIVLGVVLPERLPQKQHFAKIGTRSAMVIAMVNCVVMRFDDGTVRVALGSVGPVPVRARTAEEFIAQHPEPSDSALTEFARLVSTEVSPITDHRSTESYRRHASGVLAKRLLERCLTA